MSAHKNDHHFSLVPQRGNCNLFRLHGSYEALKYGTSLDGLSDLTGGIAESIPIRPSSTELPATLGHLLKLTSIVLAKLDESSRDKSTEINEVI